VRVVAKGDANAWVIVRECGEGYAPCSQPGGGVYCGGGWVVVVQRRRKSLMVEEEETRKTRAAGMTAGDFVLGCECEVT